MCFNEMGRFNVNEFNFSLTVKMETATYLERCCEKKQGAIKFPSFSTRSYYYIFYLDQEQTSVSRYFSVTVQEKYRRLNLACNSGLFILDYLRKCLSDNGIFI